ncbi:zinc finger protein 90 homolog [Orussus abietinus]|uniref:zinc finger protein 90 homolog n=1 Tax=Orussus abietinus TaxID=222816 RepID=UPI000626D83B|nr:zinc finger protein 90 homolog [Orussus abietinus]
MHFLPAAFEVQSAVNLLHGGSTLNVCSGCGKAYKWRDSLLRHQRVECGNKEKKFCCRLCPKRFYHRYKLNEHYKERKYSPGAAIEWYYQYQSLYLRLMAENQLTEASFSSSASEHPGKLIEEPGKLVEDFQEVENVQNSSDPKHLFVNPIACERTSPRINHNVSASSKDASGYSCPRCGNAYARHHSLNRHIRFECGVEPQFECPICHKKSKHKHNLMLHMRTHQKS